MSKVVSIPKTPKKPDMPEMPTMHLVLDNKEKKELRTISSALADVITACWEEIMSAISVFFYFAFVKFLIYIFYV